MDVESNAVQTHEQGLGHNFRSGPGSKSVITDGMMPSIPASIDTTRRTGKWTVVEDSKLKDTVHTHGDNAWVVATALVPGRTKRYMGRRQRHQTEGCGTNAICVPGASDLLLGRDEQTEALHGGKKSRRPLTCFNYYQSYYAQHRCYINR
jgi:hypothetical protein